MVPQHRSSATTPVDGLVPLSVAAALCLLADGWRVFCSAGCHWNAPSAFIADDVYFYLKIAENIYTKGLVSFDGLSETSGFHPLWLLMIVGLRKLISNPDIFFGVFYVTHQLCCWLGGLLLYRVVATRFGHSTWLIAACLVYILAGAHISAGMEIGLVLLVFPIWFGAASDYLERPGVGGAAYFGLISAVLALARLDSVILIAVAASVMYLQQFDPRRLASMLMRAIAFFAGLTPLFCYALWSKLRFDTWVPISGVAKSLKPHIGLEAVPFVSMYSTMGLTSALCVASVAASGASVLRLLVHRNLLGSHRPLIFSILAFPHLLLLTTSLRSDWALWPWYAYPFILAGAISLIVIGAAPAASDRVISQPSRLAGIFAPLAAVSVVFVSVVIFKLSFRSGPGFDSDDQVALPVAQWARNHPGIYAMGDGAGIVGYRLKQPLIHTEGLVADQVMIEHIRAGDDLVKVLRQAGARYYITFRATADGPCWTVKEPHVAGPGSPRMLGRFCDPPVMNQQYTRLSEKISLMIFDVSPGRGVQGSR